jgi:nucleoside-diphosphate-sugar epimerase
VTNRLLIIGCTGFLGRHLAQTAARHGHTILGIARSERPHGWPGDYLQASSLADLDAVIRDYAPTVVMHAAGPASVDASFVDPLDDLHGSVLTWAKTLEGVRRSGRHPLVWFPSTAAVYGNPMKLPIAEDAAVAPISPYGFHKAACELLAREYAECFGLDVVVCRFFSVFGRAQRRLLIWELYQKFSGRDPVVWLDGAGSESRDYLDIDDAIAAVLHVVDNRMQARSDGSSREGRPFVVNVASGEEINVLALAEQLRQLIAPRKDIRCRGVERKGHPRRWRADIQRLRSLAPSWRPTPFPVALARCVTAWRDGVHVP